MTSANASNWLHAPLAKPNETMRHQAQQRQAQLTKPPGSLGHLESVAIQLAALQNTPQPCADRVHIAVFAGDHGIAAEGVSAFPQSVTGEMIGNFARGGAAINVLAEALQASLEIINLGTVTDTGALATVMHYRLGPGTANFLHAPAMTTLQLNGALWAGREAIERAHENNAHLFIGGEMGIGNTTSATALVCSLLQRDPDALTGAGTGLDANGIQHKASVIARALAHHHASIDSPLEALRHLGGFEIAALTGAYIHGAQTGLPLLIDGFIATTAALAAEMIAPGCKQWFIFSHQSAEAGHGILLDALTAEPLLALDMRLGEGSGAAVAVSLLRSACQLHNRMATFAEAQVSSKHNQA